MANDDIQSRLKKLSDDIDMDVNSDDDEIASLRYRVKQLIEIVADMLDPSHS